MARLPSFADTWRASVAGVDLSPPLNVWLTRGTHAVTGVGPISTRLPALIGFSVALWTVFAVLHRRAGLTAATSGALLLFFTAGLRYAAEARAYGVMMGLAAVALYAWLEAAAGRRRFLQVPLLGVALAASLWNHYFGILVFAPVVAGEVVRLIQNRRLDAPIAAAIAAAAVAAVPLLPLVAVASQQRSTFWSGRTSHVGIADGYGFLLAPMLEPPFLAAAIVIAAFIGAAAMMHRIAPDVRRVCAHEAVALTVGLVIPLLGLVLGFVTSAVVPRYFLSAIPFIGIVLPLAIWRANTRRSPAPLVACAFLIVLTGINIADASRLRFRDPVAGRSVLLESLRSPSPTVVSSSLQFLQLWYYAPADLRGRMVYLADPSEALERSGSDTIDRGYLALSRWTAVPIETFEAFANRFPGFRVYEAGSGWLLGKLEENGAAIEEIEQEPGGRLVQVTLRR